MARHRPLPNDAWLPLTMVREERAENLQGLAGHHALAVVDQERDRLVLARDEMGEKPLLVATVAGRPVAFASTLPALRALGVDAGPSPQGVARLFRFGAVGPPVARCSEVAVEADLVGVHVSEGEGPLQPLRPVAEPASLPFAEALTAAVGRCADSSVPAALSLSGGIDSSCLAAELGAQRVRLPAYQFCAHGQSQAERVVAQMVARHCDLPFRPVDAGPEVLDALPALTAAYGMPLGDPSILAVHAVASAAAQDGAKVLLSGEGADEFLLGYARHRAARWLPRRRVLSPWTPRWAMGRMARSLRAFLAPEPYAELLSVTPPGFRSEVLAEELAAASLPEISESDPLERVRALDQAFYLRWDLLPKLDVATMAAGVEGRCPFLDGAVRAACGRMPARQVLGKQPLRDAFANRLPAEVFRQRKQGFALPLDQWFRGELPWLDLLREQRTCQRAHLRAGGLTKAIDRHRQGQVNLGHALYLLVAYEWHLRCAEEERQCA